LTDSDILRCFDGHNDVLLSLRERSTGFLERGETGHVDAPRAREGGLGGGFCAVFTPTNMDTLYAGTADLDDEEKRRRIFELFRDESTMPPSPELAEATEFAIGIMARLFRIEQESAGGVSIVKSAGEIEACLGNGVFAALLHIEGAEAIDPAFDSLEVFHRAGLRSIGPVWSRPNAYGHGVPFAFGCTPDTGPGLTDAGRRLVGACNRQRIMIDLSHINEKGFWDVADLTDSPLVATHSNAWTLCHSSRNLTDKQLDAIGESDGMVGVNFCVGFLREDGKMEAETPLEEIVRHIDYLVDRIGIDHVGFGSDFDGALVPDELGDCTGLPKIVNRLRERGYDDVALRKLTSENWVRLLRSTWGA
jgi:membrane dipeptidase